MAANDPSFDVPTPRGVLQGVAVFTHDGANWQPAGRAATEVATPTGVLRGVAAFTGGPNWAPVARAQTEVPTPSGVLDGVAVYTWDGTKWVPPSGNIETATPSGVLEGVAAFDWDGANWQPQAQAGAEVPTPYGVLTGVARFGWTGSAWAAVSSGPPGMTLSLDFMNPGTLDPRIVFSRASSATYTDASGVVRTAATNAPRWDYASGSLRGLLIEEARTNLVLASAGLTGWSAFSTTVTASSGVAPDTNNAAIRIAEVSATASHSWRSNYTTVASTAYTFSAYAKAQQNQFLQMSMDDNTAANGAYVTFDLINGTISQALTALGTGVITGASIQPAGNGFFRCTMTTTVGAATTTRLIFGMVPNGTPGFLPTYAGNAANGVLVWGMQLEQGAFATSLIPTTSSAVLRAADLAAMPLTPGATGTYAAQFIPAGAAASLPVIISGNAGSPVMSVGADSRLVAAIKGGAAVFSGVAPNLTFNSVNKTAFAWLTGASKAAVNGTLLGANAAALTVSGTTLQLGSDGVIPGNNAIDGALQSVQGWPRQLSDAELQQVTT